tara:strand:+ start:6517 stop:7701 length:1185 start_codon:yes stop_codon:yes gene_type:complete
MATTTAQKLVSEITADRLIIDMADDIERLDPDAGPLTLLLRKLNSAPCTQETIEWLESELEDRLDTVKTTQNSTTTLGVSDTTIWHKYDIGIIPLTGYKFIVSSVTADPLDTVQLDAGTAVTATAAENVFKIGNAVDEGGDAIAPYEGTVSTVTNMVQIFEQSWQVSESLKQSGLYGGDERARLTAEKRIEHERDIEQILFWGERSDSLAGMNSVVAAPNLAGGAEFYINLSGSNATATNVAGSITESTWIGFLADIYQYQSDKPRYIFASVWLMRALANWAGGKLRLVPKDKTYGIAISEYIHPFGANCYIINNRRTLSYGEDTTNVGYEGYNFALCLDALKLRTQEGLNTKLHMNVQDPGARRVMDLIRTYCSLEFRLPELHGALTGITGVS